MCSVILALSPGTGLVLEVLLVVRSSQDTQMECEVSGSRVSQSYRPVQLHGATSPLGSCEPKISTSHLRWSGKQVQLRKWCQNLLNHH